MVSIRRRHITLAAMTATALGACVLTAVPASAAPASNAPVSITHMAGPAISPSPVKTFTFTKPAGRTPDGVTTPAATINCGLEESQLLLIPAGDPFGPYTPSPLVALGAEGQVVCTAPVTSIALNEYLAYEGEIDAVGPEATSTGSSESPVAYVADVCTGGSWQVGGSAVVTAPAGFSPPVFDLTSLSESLYVDPEECL